MKVYAQDLGNIDVPGDLLNLGGILQRLLFLAFFLAGAFLLLQVIIGGISYLSSGGDDKALTAARSRITSAVIGFIIVIAAFAITVLVTSVFGLNIFQEGGVRIN